jgi:predicted acetyltransferase
MKVKIVPVKIDDRDVLKEMLWEYEKEMLGGEPGEYKYLDSYWQKQNRFPFFIEGDEKILGFALINDYNLVIDDGKNIAEFYIKKELRKNGIGKEASRQVFNLFPAKWEIRQIVENPKAHNYWLKIISEFTKNNFTEEFVKNDKWHGWIQTFDMNRNRF